MRVLFWALVVAVLSVGCWKLYLRDERSRVYSGTVLYRDGRPLDTLPEQTSPQQPSAVNMATTQADPTNPPSPSLSQAPPSAANPTPVVPTGTEPAQGTSGAPQGSLQGVVYAAAGHFEWYRFGDLTWRLNLEDGGSCIAFATPQAWQRPRVFDHGCSENP